jgi:hypothetical protein
MFYGLSRFPHHAQYLNLFVALAPVAWVGNMKGELTDGNSACFESCVVFLLRYIYVVFCWDMSCIDCVQL